MDAFKDEVYENMDDISKLIEPFEIRLNNELAKFPDEIEITPRDLSKNVGNYYSESGCLSLNDIVRDHSYSLGLLDIYSECSNSDFIIKLFVFEHELEEGSSNISFDFVNQKIIGGKIFLRKKAVALEDNDIELKMNKIISNMIYKFPKTVDKGRFNAVAEVFGAKEARKATKSSDKIRNLIIHYRQMLTNKQLPIKDFNLFERFIDWNVKYIKDGSLPAFANLTRLKIMLRSGLPIYSMKEEDV